MKRKPKAQPKRAAREEYQRFLDTARKVEASDDPQEFERAFKRVVLSPASSRRPTSKRRP